MADFRTLIIVLILIMLMVLWINIIECRAFFVFGDSLVDDGGNNFLATTARADSPPYVIDYPTRRPTGQVSNFAGDRSDRSQLCFCWPWILNDTGIQFVNIVKIHKQLKPFKHYQFKLSGLIGPEKANKHVNEALVLITLGGNDFVNNYYLCLSVPSPAGSISGIASGIFTGTRPLGCVPAELGLHSKNGECITDLQRVAALFNPPLVEMVKGINAEIGSDVFAAANAYVMNMDSVSRPQQYVSYPTAEARAFFVFGDSLVDSGNNNYLATTARADSPPYGVDFPTHRATGRFSNGLNIPDLISEQIGNEEPPLPYLSPELSGRRLLNGANFASAGIGILNDTGIQFLNIIRMHQQLDYFERYQQRVSDLIGRTQMRRLVNQALVLVTVGGNDFVNNYYLVPYSARSRQFTLPDYVSFLISEYKKLLLRLYSLGACRVIVTGTGPMGCVPAELASRGSAGGGCSAELQRAAALYNPQLVQMINGLNRKTGRNVFIAANTNQMHMDFISNPQAFGFITAKVACCGQGSYNGVGLCTILSNLCRNRDLYAFWDSFHPSEKANRIIVDQIFTGSTQYMNPMNLSSILTLDSST